jgi:hypothetical protein
MKKSFSRYFSILGLLSLGGGIVLNGIAFQTSHLGAGMPFIFLALIFFLISWVGALIKTAQLGSWGWFISLLIFSVPTLLFYIFWGPNSHAS